MAMSPSGDHGSGCCPHCALWPHFPSSPTGAAGTRKGRVMESHHLNVFAMSSGLDTLNPATGAKKCCFSLGVGVSWLEASGCFTLDLPCVLRAGLFLPSCSIGVFL